jgi:hypothetical protein
MLNAALYRGARRTHLHTRYLDQGGADARAGCSQSAPAPSRHQQARSSLQTAPPLFRHRMRGGRTSGVGAHAAQGAGRNAARVAGSRTRTRAAPAQACGRFAPHQRMRFTVVMRRHNVERVPLLNRPCLIVRLFCVRPERRTDCSCKGIFRLFQFIKVPDDSDQVVGIEMRALLLPSSFLTRVDHR